MRLKQEEEELQGTRAEKTFIAIPLRKRIVRSTLSEAVVGGGRGGARTGGGEEGAGITFGDRGVWRWGKRGSGRCTVSTLKPKP